MYDFNDGSGTKLHYARKIIIHPEHGSPTDQENDIALIQMEKPVMTFNQHVRPICLPRPHQRPPVNSTCCATGKLFLYAF